jgi:hypothetical protein
MKSKIDRYEIVKFALVDPFFNFLHARGWKDENDTRILGRFTKDGKEITLTQHCIHLPPKVWGSEGVNLFQEFLKEREHR